MSVSENHHLVATGLAAHAVVVVVLGGSLNFVECPDSGRMGINVKLDDREHLWGPPSCWAYQVAGLRRIRDLGHYSKADRIDVLFSCEEATGVLDQYGIRGADVSLKETKRLVDTHWPLISTVADELFRRGYLDGSDVRYLVDNFDH